MSPRSRGEGIRGDHPRPGRRRTGADRPRSGEGPGDFGSDPGVDHARVGFGEARTGRPGPRRTVTTLLFLLALAMLRLYPGEWRGRYSPEVRELLRQHQARPRTLVDLMLGAADAWLHPGLLADPRLTPVRRARTGQFLICGATVLYAVALVSLYRVRDPTPPWAWAVKTHPAIGVAFDAIEVTGGLAVLAGLAGGALLVVAMIRQAIAGRQPLRRTLGLASLVATAWIAITLACYAVISGRPGSGIRPLRTMDLLLEMGWLLASLVASLAGARLLWRGLGQADFTPRLMRLTRVTAAGLVLAMTAGLVATACEAGLVLSGAPALMGPGWLATIGLAMTGAVLMASIAWRGSGGLPVSGSTAGSDHR